MMAQGPLVEVALTAIPSNVRGFFGETAPPHGRGGMFEKTEASRLRPSVPRTMRFYESTSLPLRKPQRSSRKCRLLWGLFPYPEGRGNIYSDERCRNIRNPGNFDLRQTANFVSLATAYFIDPGNYQPDHCCRKAEIHKQNSLSAKRGVYRA